MTSALLIPVPPPGGSAPALRPSAPADPAGRSFGDSLRRALAGPAVPERAMTDAGSPATERRRASNADDVPSAGGEQPASGVAALHPGVPEPVFGAVIATSTAPVVASAAVPPPDGGPAAAVAPAGGASPADTVPPGGGPSADTAPTARAGAAPPGASAPVQTITQPSAPPGVPASPSPSAGGGEGAGQGLPGDRTSSSPPDGASGAPVTRREGLDAPHRADPSTPAAPPLSATPSSVLPPPADAPITPAPRSIAAQVVPPLLRLARLPEGTHRLTLVVAPESVGPITVRAHIGAGGDVRIELLTATDVARDALRGMLGELRRDLAAIAPSAHVAVGGGTASDSPPRDPGAQGSAPGPDGERDAPTHRSAPIVGPAVPPTPTSRAALGEGLDILV